MEFEVRHTRVVKEDILAEIEALEQQYGVPTERFDEAFRDAEGVLYETPDFLHWCMLKTMLRRLYGDERHG